MALAERETVYCRTLKGKQYNGEVNYLQGKIYIEKSQLYRLPSIREHPLNLLISASKHMEIACNKGYVKACSELDKIESKMNSIANAIVQNN